jgi:Winged helix DNA-binding domain
MGRGSVGALANNAATSKKSRFTINYSVALATDRPLDYSNTPNKTLLHHCNTPFGFTPGCERAGSGRYLLFLLMTPRDIAYSRLINQQIAGARCQRPSEIVSLLGAVQAQDYLGALWAIGLRTPNSTEADIEKAIGARTIIRSWPMRGTLHFVAPADIRWMLELLTPPVIAASKRRQQQLDLDDKTLARCRAVITKALQGDKQLNREAMYSSLEAAHISTDSQRGYHILWRLAQEGTICFAARQGKQLTFALLDEWVKPAKKLKREEALAELAKRYFIGHGPATLQDFAWWSGLTVTEAKVGLEMVASSLRKETSGTTIHWMSPEATAPLTDFPIGFLLPGFDEYMLGYKDRSAILEPQHAQKLIPDNNGRFLGTMVLKGRVVGTWKRRLGKKTIVLTMEPFVSLQKSEGQAFARAARMYGEYIGLPVVVNG